MNSDSKNDEVKNDEKVQKEKEKENGEDEKVENLEQKTNENEKGEEIIKVNVGGKIFTTFQRTLMKIPFYKTQFSLLTSGKFEIEKDENGIIFIDRDPKYFNEILNYVRDGNVSFSVFNSNSYKDFMKECDYYGVIIDVDYPLVDVWVKSKIVKNISKEVMESLVKKNKKWCYKENGVFYVNLEEFVFLILIDYEMCNITDVPFHSQRFLNMDKNLFESFLEVFNRIKASCGESIDYVYCDLCKNIAKRGSLCQMRNYAHEFELTIVKKVTFGDKNCDEITRTMCCKFCGSTADNPTDNCKTADIYNYWNKKYH